MQLTFVSGWSGIPELYPTIAQQSNFVIPFWHHSTAQVGAAIAAGGDTLVGWSTGAHLILQQLNSARENFSNIILLAPFLAFSRCFHPRIIKLMQQRLSKEPQATITDFWHRCGINHPCPNIDAKHITTLDQGLEFLATSILAVNKVASGQITLVCCSEDQIVSRKEFDTVANSVENTATIAINSQHFVPEPQLLRMLKNVTGTALI